MARKRKAVAAKKAPTTKENPKKVIRRRNEKNEVVEIEVDDIPVEKATMRIYVETTDKLLERRKRASNHLASITGKSLKDKTLKEKLGHAIVTIDKRIASMK